MSAGQRKRGDYRLHADYTTIPNRLYDEWIPALNRSNFQSHGDVLGVVAQPDDRLGARARRHRHAVDGEGDRTHEA